MIQKIHFLSSVVYFAILISFFAAGQQQDSVGDVEDENLELWQLGCQTIWPDTGFNCKHFVQSAVGVPARLLENEGFDAAIGCMEQKTVQTCEQYRPESTSSTLIKDDGGPCEWCSWDKAYSEHFGVSGTCIHKKLNEYGCVITAAASLGYLIKQKGLEMPKSWEQAKCLRASSSAKDCQSVTEEKCSFCPLPKAYGWYKQFPGFCFQESVMKFDGSDQCANLHDLPEGAYDFLIESTATTTRNLPPVIPGSVTTTTQKPATTQKSATTQSMSGAARIPVHQEMFFIAAAAVLLILA